jgi:hydrogenase nickel incorporation protein HypA/HybF
MHDIMFAGRIIHLLKTNLGQDKSKRATVNVMLGPFTHVTPESLRSAFALLSKQEGFTNAALNIEKRKAAIKCAKCRKTTEIDSPVVTCPSCGADDFDLLNTEELVIMSIETEGA